MSNNAGKKGKKAVSAVLVLVVIAGLAAAYFLTEDYRAYTEGVKLLESRAYGAAAEIFEEIPDKFEENCNINLYSKDKYSSSLKKLCKPNKGTSVNNKSNNKVIEVRALVLPEALEP